jgi:hypothetical protein
MISKKKKRPSVTTASRRIGLGIVMTEEVAVFTLNMYKGLRSMTLPHKIDDAKIG